MRIHPFPSKATNPQMIKPTIPYTPNPIAMIAISDPIYFLTPAQRSSLIDFINQNITITGGMYPCDNLLQTLLSIVQTEGVCIGFHTSPVDSPTCIHVLLYSISSSDHLQIHDYV